MDKTEQIRERAHQIWEAEGRPEGRDADHWQRARHELGLEDGTDTLSMPDDLPDLTSPPRNEPTAAGQSDGHIIEAGEGGTSDMPDEAQLAVDDPLSGTDGKAR
ncbi:MAG: DUF2934 domain-containing protein [Paracoccus sp.]|nr:DUF2934 domain-containing protein [Paracoccus sp. (in: a-proteobacteria)]